MITSTDIKNLDGTQSDVTVAEFVAAAKSKTSNPLGFIKVHAGQTLKSNLTHSNMQSFTVSKSVCSSGQFTVGSMVAGELDITLLTSTVNDWQSSLASFWFEPYIGYTCVHDNEEVNAYIKLGKFSIDTSQTKKNGLFTTLVAYDNLYSKSLDATLPSAFSLNMNTNPKANMDALLNAATLTNMFDTDELPDDADDKTYINITSDMTIKEAVGRIAIAGGRNCMTNRDGKIAFYHPTTKNTADVSIDGSHFNSIDIDDSDSTLVQYVTAEYDRELDSEKSASYPSSYSDYAVGLSFDNSYFPWVYNETDNRQEPLFDVVQRLIGDDSGYTYQGHTLTSPSLCFIDPFDRVDVDASVVYGNGNTFILRPMTIKTTYNGAIITEISASTIDKQNSSNETVDVKIESAGKVITDKLTNIATAHYGTCSTAGDEAVKEVDLDNFQTLYKGATVSVKFTEANEWDDIEGNVQLKVEDTEAKPIYADGVALGSMSMYDWSAGQIVDFLYDGDYWNIIGINITRYMSFDDSGLHLAQNNDGTGFNVTIGSGEMSFNYDNLTQLALSSNGITIGSDNTDKVVLTDDGVFIYNYSNVTASLVDNNLTASDIVVRYLKFNKDAGNAGSSDTTLVWEKRENGHLSLKVGDI